MAKRYLNTAEKQVLLTMGGFNTYFSTKLEEYEKIGYKGPNDFMKYFKMAKTFSFKAMVEMTKDLENQELKTILNQCAKMIVTTHPEKQQVQELLDIQKVKDNTTLPNDDFIFICAQAIQVCQGCKKTGDEKTNCELMQLFKRYEIEPYNFEAEIEAGMCPYLLPKD